MMLFDGIDTHLSVAIARTLLHSLWQGVLIALLAAATSLLLRRHAAHARCVVAAASLAAMPIVATVTFCAVYGNASTEVRRGVGSRSDDSTSLSAAGPSVPGATEAASAASSSERGVRTDVTSGTTSTPTSTAAATTPALFPSNELARMTTAIYGIGALAMLLRLALALASGHGVKRCGAPVVDSSLITALREEARRLGLKCAPAVRYSERVLVPAVIGVVKPTLVLPAAVVTGLAPQQLAAVLAHELAHIRRHDAVVQIGQRVVEALFFFHPAVWYLSRQLSVERENACDDVVVGAGHESCIYAAALVRVVELSHDANPGSHGAAAIGPATLAAAHSRGHRLRARVLRLIQRGERSDLRLTRSGAASFFLAVGLLAASCAYLGVEGGRSLASKEPEATAVYRGDNGRSGAYDVAPLHEVGGVRWAFRTPAGFTSTPAVVGGVAYTATADGFVRAYDIESGEKKWERTVGNSGLISTLTVTGAADALPRDRAVCFGDLKGKVTALDADDGEVLWTHDAGGSVPGALPVADGIVYIAGYDDDVLALSLASGEEIWRTRTGGIFLGPPALVGDTLYLVADNHCVALDASTGREIWRRRVDGPSGLVVAAGVVLVGNSHGRRKLLALDATNGEPVWSFETDPFTGDGWLMEPGLEGAWPAVADGRVFFPTFYGELYALDAVSGEELWRFAVDGPCNASPAVAGDLVYVSNLNGSVSALDVASGELIWRFAGTPGFVTCPIPTANGLLVGSSDGYLYEFAGDAAPESAKAEPNALAPSVTAWLYWQEAASAIDLDGQHVEKLPAGAQVDREKLRQRGFDLVSTTRSLESLGAKLILSPLSLAPQDTSAAELISFVDARRDGESSVTRGRGGWPEVCFRTAEGGYGYFAVVSWSNEGETPTGLRTQVLRPALSLVESGDAIEDESAGATARGVPSGRDDAANPGDAELFRIYDVGDLFVMAGDPELPLLGVPVDEGTSVRAAPQRSRKQVEWRTALGLKGLAQRIAAELAASGITEDAFDLETRGDRQHHLLFRGSLAHHEAIAAALTRLREQRKQSSVMIDVAQIVVRDGEPTLPAAVSTWLEKIRASDHAGVERPRLTDDDFKQLRKAALKDAPLRPWFAHIGTGTGEPNWLSGTTDVAFIRDLKVSEVEGVRSATPIVAKCATGYAVGVIAERSADNTAAQLELQASYCNLARTPIATLPASEMERFRGVKGAEAFEIGVPEFARFDLNTSVACPFGDWVIAAAFNHGFESEDQEREPEATDDSPSAVDSDAKTSRLAVTALLLVRTSPLNAEEKRARDNE